jgi:hypothetical protein
MSAPNRRSAVYVDPSPGATHVGSPPTVAELAVSTAGQLDSLAETVMPDPFRIKRALQLLHCDTSPLVRTTLHLDGAVAKQYYFLVNDAVRVISCPTQATDSSNNAVCLANLGDQLEDFCPVRFSPEEFGAYFVTLVPKGTVAKYGLPTSTSNPIILAPSAGGQPGDERLHWNPILEPAVDIPCFGAFLLACPVLPGNPAFDPLHIRDDLEASSVTNAPMFARWFAGLQYLY